MFAALAVPKDRFLIGLFAYASQTEVLSKNGQANQQAIADRPVSFNRPVHRQHTLAA